MSVPKRKTIMIAVAALGLLVAGVTIISVFGERKPSEEVVARDVPTLQDGMIRVSDHFVRRAKLGFEVATDRELSPVLDVTGVATFDPFRLAVVGARIEGRIHAVLKREGDRVKAGEVIVELESAEVGRAQAEVLKARAREVAATAEEQRAETLAEGKIISVREAELAKSSAIAVRAERAAAESAVLALGGDPDATNIGVLRIRSPISGHLVHVGVHRGEVVDAKTNVFKVADLSQLWVELRVFAQDIVAVRKGDAVELKLQGIAAGPYKGRVDYVAATVDSETLSAEVRVVLDNALGEVRPGLAVRAKIMASGPKAHWLSVSNEAIVRVDGKPTVFVARDEHTMEIKTVTLGSQTQTHTAILAGLKEGDRVVNSGAFALKSEIFR